MGGANTGADAAFTPDGRFVAADDWGDVLRFYTVPDLQLVTHLVGHCAVFLADGRSAIYASRNRIVRRASPAAPGAGENVLGRGPAKIHRLAVSPDGHLLAACTWHDGGLAIYLWDADHGTPLGKLIGHAERVSQVAFSPDGRWLAAAAGDGTIRLWHAPAWAENEAGGQ